MDFTFTPEQDEAAALAARILKDRATNDRMKAVEAAGSRFDRELWAELGAPGSWASPPRGVRRRRARPRRAVPGARRGRPDGRAGARWPRTAPLTPPRGARRRRAKDQWLPGAASGELVLTAAVAEDRAFAPERPTTTARRRRRRLQAHRHQDHRPGGHRRRRCSSCPPRPRTASPSSWSSRATTGVTVTAQRSPTATRSPASTSTACAVPSARLVGAADGSARRAAPAPAARWPPPPSSSASPRARWRSPRRTPRPASSSAARSARSRPSRSGSPTATSTPSASG